MSIIYLLPLLLLHQCDSLVPRRRAASPAPHWSPLVLSASKEDEAQRLLEKAAQLRAEAEALSNDESLPAAAGMVGGETAEEASAAAQDRAMRRLSINLPISKPDFTVVDEDVEFAPSLPLGTSELVRIAAPLPLGLILEEGGADAEENDGVPEEATAAGSPVGRGFTWVAEVADEGNAAGAGVRVGDVLRACSAVKVQMEMPTWQLLGGGIGRPRPFRFIYSVDQRPFEEVMEAVGSNRLDPEARDVLLVVERPI